MLKEIEQDIEDEKIEEQKQSSKLRLTFTGQEQEKVTEEEVPPPVYTGNSDKPKTRKELRQERLRKEEEEKKKSDKEKGKQQICIGGFTQLQRGGVYGSLEGQPKKKEKKEVKDKRKGLGG